MISIFPDKSLMQKLQTFDLGDRRKEREIILNWQKAIKDGSVLRTKEEALQADFLNNFFGEVLDYEYNQGKGILNLVKENKTETDSTKSDGALGFFEDGKRITKVVIELKDAKTDLDKPQNRKNDRRSPVEQAFSYASKSGGQCKWVIVSNFLEIRLYHSSDQGKYEVFNILDLLNLYELKRFFFLLQKERLIAENTDSEIDLLYAQRQAHEINIEKEFYNKFKQLRQDLFTHLKQENKNINENILLEKAQKILDRFIFIFFCEDLIPPLLPSDTTDNLIKQYKNERYNINNDFLWTRLKNLFESIDQGNPRADINKFNGGLFAQDTLLDSLIIKDEILNKIILLGPKYDFVSDLNVNILGHIFEQSISDIEELKAQISTPIDHLKEETGTKQKIGKRKKDGIFYTPAYITKYIIEQTVGKWLEDKKQELNFNELPELDYSLLDPEVEIKDLTKTQKTQLLKAQKEHLEFWLAYKENLSNIKILDPACGSGAFLNQAFDYLYIEHLKIDEIIASLKDGQRDIIENLNKLILQNNLFGVDLNEESVEITKLSLWLKTANKSSELTSLDNNIKCGNSLIDDPEVAGKKAFNWNKQFKGIGEIPKVCIDSNILFDYFRDKQQEGRASQLIQLAEAEGINLKVSTRVKFETNQGRSQKLDEELAFVESLNSLPCIGRYDISYWDNGDIYPSEENIEIWQKIKNIIFSGLDLLNPPEGETEKQKKKRIGRIIDCDHLLTASGIVNVKKVDYFITNNTQDFINNGKREKLQKLLNIKILTLGEFLDQKIDRAFGFDIIIGNPPYVQFVEYKDYYSKNYKVFECGDLYTLFIEKSVKLLKNNGSLGFIIPSLFIKNVQYFSLREFLVNNVQINEIKEMGDKVFDDVKMPTAIITLKNKITTNQNWDDFLQNSNVIKNIEKQTFKIQDLTEIMRGLEIGKDKLSSKSNYKILAGEDIKRYGVLNISYISEEIYNEFKKNRDFFSGERLYIRETGERINCIYLEDENILCTRSLYSIKAKNKDLNLKYLLAILNSQVVQNYYSAKYKANTNIFPKIRIIQVKQIPIPNISLFEQKPFIEKADLMLEKNKELQNLKQRFLAELKLEKLTKKLENFEELSFDEFIAEYTKTKKIKFKDKLDERNFKNNWLALFENDKKEVLQIKGIINQTDEAIDELVYELYGLTTEEREIIKGKI